MGDLHVSIETVEEHNFGDHAERLRTSHVVVPGETVEALVRRVFPKLESMYRHHNPTDEVVIRVALDSEGKVPTVDPVNPDPWATSTDQDQPPF